MVYEFVDAKGLSIEELKLSRLPDDTLISVWVEFASSAGRHYKAFHNPGLPCSYIRLVGLEKAVRDCEAVAATLARLTGGQSEGNMFDRGKDIVFDIVRIHDRLTQSRVAVLAEAYQQQFRDVQVSAACFGNVPESAYENSGLPLEKLTAYSVGKD